MRRRMQQQQHRASLQGQEADRTGQAQLSVARHRIGLIERRPFTKGVRQAPFTKGVRHAPFTKGVRHAST